MEPITSVRNGDGRIGHGGQTNRRFMARLVAAGFGVMTESELDRPFLAEPTDRQRAEAMVRFAVLRLALENDVLLTICAAERDAPLRTLQLK